MSYCQSRVNWFVRYELELVFKSILGLYARRAPGGDTTPSSLSFLEWKRCQNWHSLAVGSLTCFLSWSSRKAYRSRQIFWCLTYEELNRWSAPQCPQSRHSLQTHLSLIKTESTAQEQHTMRLNNIFRLFSRFHLWL